MAKTSAGQKRIKGKLPSKMEAAHRIGSSFTNDEGLTVGINDIGIVTLPRHYLLFRFLYIIRLKSSKTEKESSQTYQKQLGTII